jgi:hypothetical protein
MLGGYISMYHYIRAPLDILEWSIRMLACPHPDIAPHVHSMRNNLSENKTLALKEYFYVRRISNE